jgi:uncharacterized DUF497 family protein
MPQFEYSEWLEKFLDQLVFYFDWDSGNNLKSVDKHNIAPEESEEVFYDEYLFPVGIQKQPITNEMRLAIIGSTSSNKILFVSFTLRESKIRIISARPASKKERRYYNDKKIC